MLYVLDTNILSAMRFDPALVTASDVATTPFNLDEVRSTARRVNPVAPISRASLGS